MNLSALSSLTTAATSLSGLILVTPNSKKGAQPQNPPQPNGQPSVAELPPTILFNFEGENTSTLTSDITDHYIEDNTAIEDQIALKPEEVMTHGFIGELNNVPPKALELLKEAADKLTIIGAYAPVVSTSAQIAYNNALLLYQTGKNAVTAAVSAWSSITGGASQVQTQQQIYYQQFYGYWRTRTLFTVQTPWAIFDNMAIKTLRAIQSEETRMITDFEVTFKKIRTAQTASVSGVAAILQGRAALQASAAINFGSQTPIPSQSLGTGLAKMGVN